MRTAGKTGLTLLELLIVISVIGVLAGFLIPAFNKARGRAAETRADADAKLLETAIVTYRMQEGRMPAPIGHLTQGADRVYGTTEDNRLVIDQLLDAEPTVLETGRLRMDEIGNVLDPWGRQYRIWLDLDGDNKIEVGGDSFFVRQRVRRGVAN